MAIGARSFIIIPYEGAAAMQCARDVEQAVVRDVMLRRQRAILAPRHRQRLLFQAMLWRMMNDCPHEKPLLKESNMKIRLPIALLDEAKSSCWQRRDLTNRPQSQTHIASTRRTHVTHTETINEPPRLSKQRMIVLNLCHQFTNDC
jgi:hypothetical protein